MDESQKFRTPVIIAVILLASVFVVGLRWVFTASPSTEGALFYLFDYAVGLTMIFLPCTLPLAFVIVPLAMGKGFARGLGIAVSFALGVTITLSLYGGFLGWVGGHFISAQGSNLGQVQANAQARAEFIKNIMYAIAGTLGFLFALGDIGLTGFRMPTYSGAFPEFIQRQQEFLKAGLLGLFLGNIGVGCPNPLFNTVIVPQILISGGAFQGWLIMLVQALGRITPLFLLAFLAILGVNATSFLVAHRTKVEKATGWAMVFVAGFLFTLGVFTHDWYVYSGIHTYLESLTQEEFITNILGRQIGQLGHTHAVPTINQNILAWGSYVMVTIWLIPFAWLWARRRKEARMLADPEKSQALAQTKTYGWFIGAMALLLYLLFGHVLPDNFLFHTAHTHAPPKVTLEIHTMPDKPVPNEAAILLLSLKDEKGNPLAGLEIEHERLLHVILVSEDLTQFLHTHPEDVGRITDDMKKRATFPIQVVFPKAGKYALAVNALYKGGEIVLRGTVGVDGSREPVTLKKDLSREKNVDGLSVTLKTDPAKMTSGMLTHMLYTVYDSKGNPVKNLEGYLGAPMHIAVWSFDLEYFLHTHGEVPGFGHTVTQTDKFGPSIDSHIIFPYPGLYKVIGQFARNGKIYTASFTVEVAPGSGIILEAMPHVH